MVEIIGAAVIIIIIIILYIQRHTLPPGMQNGDVVRCNQDGAVYKIENYTKRHYANYTVYYAYGSPAYKEWNCDDLAKIPTGADM